MREGVRPRKLVDELAFLDVAGSGSASFSKGSVSSSTGDGSTSCIGRVEMEDRDSWCVKGGPEAVDAMFSRRLDCAGGSYDGLHAGNDDHGQKSQSPEARRAFWGR